MQLALYSNYFPSCFSTNFVIIHSFSIYFLLFSLFIEIYMYVFFLRAGWRIFHSVCKIYLQMLLGYRIAGKKLRNFIQAYFFLPYT